MRVLAIDTETTGLSPDGDRLIELGLVLHDDSASPGGGLDVGHASVVVNPGRPLPTEVARLTGLSSAQLQAGVDEGAALELLAFWMARADVVIAWNAPFDRAMIAAAAARTTTTLPARPWRCAMDVARHAHPEWERHRLQDAVAALGLEERPTHRALDDARAALAVWRRLVPRRADDGDGSEADDDDDDGDGDGDGDDDDGDDRADGPRHRRRHPGARLAAPVRR